MSQSAARPQLPEPGFGPGALKLTSSDGSGTASDCSSTRWNTEKIPAVAPMPSASETMATAVTNGVLKSVRTANWRLRIKTLDGRTDCGVYPLAALGDFPQLSHPRRPPLRRYKWLKLQMDESVT